MHTSPRRSRRAGLCLLLTIIIIAVMLPPPAVAQQPGPAFEAAACMFELPLFSFISPETQGFTCGYVTVPERHSQPDGPTIRLPVALLRASGANTRSDPLFMAQGGPGGDAFGVFSLLMPNSQLARERDIVIFNQRGTLYAEPSLVCRELFEILPELLLASPEEGLELRQMALTECYNRLVAEGVDLSAYNSLENAADIDAIRLALGYETINFYGVSYGTLLGLHLMRERPAYLRSVILDGVVPAHVNFIPLIPQNTDRIFSRLLEACTADPGCQSEYPDLERDLFALVDRWNDRPVTLSLTDSETDRVFNARLNGDDLLGLLFQILYLPDAFAIFPKVVFDIEAGDYSFLERVASLVIFDRTVSEGMYYSVICAEDADFDPATIPLDGVRPQIAENAVSDLQETYLDVCRMWQVDPLPGRVDEPVSSDIPTLLLSGEFDPITPPDNAAAAAEYLSRSYSYIYPTGSHGLLGTDACVTQIMASFLNQPERPPQAACLDQVEASTFVPARVLKLDLLAEINELDATALIQTGLAALFLAGLLSALIIWPLIFIIRLIRKKKVQSGSKLMRWGSRGAVFLFSGLMLLFVAGLNFFIFQAISSPLISLSAISIWAAPLFIIPYLLLLLALGMAWLTSRFWLKRIGSIWGRLYYTFLTICALGYVVMLAMTGMFTVLGQVVG